MKPISSLKVALRALRINKMRSFLTMLGIIIGVGAVIVMVAIGAGAREMIAQQIASMGSNLLNDCSRCDHGRRGPDGRRQRLFPDFR